MHCLAFPKHEIALMPRAPVAGIFLVGMFNFALWRAHRLSMSLESAAMGQLKRRASDHKG